MPKSVPRSDVELDEDLDIRAPMRLSMNLNPHAAGTLKRIANEDHTTFTEVVRRSIGILAYVRAAQKRGASMAIIEDGVTQKIMFDA